MKAQITRYALRRILELGSLILFERVGWGHRQERLPRYLVSHTDGRDLEEFRRKASAVRWIHQQEESKELAH